MSGTEPENKIELLVEGWRGINHSYAMVNQFQLLELLKLNHLAVSHLDVPFAKPGWNSALNNPGFSADAMRRIRDIPGATRGHYDVVYRIASPFSRSSTPAAKHVTFMTSEFGLTPVNFLDRNVDIEFYCRERNIVVVPSNWSRMKLIEFGFPEDKVKVVSHGVAADVFFPSSHAERLALRQSIGIRPDDFVFLNLGAMTWNKGVDVLMLAFNEVRQRHANAVLLLKDDPGLYGIGATTVINRMMAEGELCMSDEVRLSIKLISDTLTMPQMRLLYGAADSYISPYRAEGFNLPVIESIACGTPVIVSRGGATDDFCDSDTARFIESRHVENAARGIEGKGYHLEPERASMVACMEAAIAAFGGGRSEFDQGMRRLTTNLSWKKCTRDLVELFELV